MGARDQRRPRTRPTSCSPPAASSRCPTVPPIPGLDELRRARRSTPRGGATTSTSPASAWPWSAPAAARSRSCPRSSRSSSSVDVYQRSPGWTIPKMDFAYTRAHAAPVRALPGRCSGSTARRSSPSWSSAPPAMTKPPLAAARRSARVGRRQINKAIEDPELRRKVTPTDEIGCKRIMLTDDWYPTLTKPNVELVTDRDRRGHADRHPHRGRRRAPGRRARARDRLQDARLRRADGDRRRRRPHARRGVGATCRAPTSG